MKKIQVQSNSFEIESKHDYDTYCQNTKCVLCDSCEHLNNGCSGSSFNSWDKCDYYNNKII